MSWSLNYLKKLQREIGRYKDKMQYMIIRLDGIAQQPELVKISKELDKLILNYQNFKRKLSEYQEVPFSVDLYMDTKINKALLAQNKIIIGEGESDNNFYLVEDKSGKIIGLIKSCDLRDNQFNLNIEQIKLIDKISFCNSGLSIWTAKKFLNENKCDFLIIIDNNRKPLGVIDKNLVKTLCSEKTMSIKANKIIYKIKETLDNLPLSIFVLDKNFYINYANIEAIKNFNNVLPANYLFKRADLVFSSLFSTSYNEFISSDFWQYLINMKEQTEIEMKLLNYISLHAGIKINRTNNDVENIVVSFVNVDELNVKVDEPVLFADELAQALNLFLPYEIETILRQIPEYRDIYNQETKKILIIQKIKDGGYWHVINCLRVLAQIERLDVLKKNNIDKDLLIKAIMVHDIGKIQPNLKIGDVVDPVQVFEKGKVHALRSAKYCKDLNYEKDIIYLVRYHHHDEGELPRNFPKKLIPTLRILKAIDGLSAAITRRNAMFNIETSDRLLMIHEDNEHPEYNKDHTIKLS